MSFKNRSQAFAALLLALSAFVACSAPGAVDPTAASSTQEPTPTVAVETPENTVTPSPTETTAAPAATETPSPEGTPGQEDPLTGTNWALESFGPAGEETPVVPDSNVTLQFDEPGHAGGSAGCNSYGGAYELEDGAFSFSPIVSTLMACADEELMDQEARYLAALQEAGEFELSPGGERLTIWANDGQDILNFTASASDAGSDSGESSAVQVARIAIFDDASGWATGRPVEATADEILITTDGGESWQVVTPQEAADVVSEPALERMAAAYFASPQQAWVAFSRPQPVAAESAPRVWLTEDGGQTWQPGDPLDLGELPFEYFGPSNLGAGEGQHGWLMAHLGAGMSHDYIAIFTTTDGGQTWQRVADPDNNPTIQACNKSGLVFEDAQQGWLSGDCPGLMQPLFLYHTTDGGATWSQAELPAPEGLTAGSLGDSCGVPQLTRQAGRTLLTLRCFDFEEESSQAWLYSSEDGGENWQAQPLPEAAGIFTFRDAAEGWYLASDESQEDQNSRIYHTADGGQTWSTLAQIDGQGQPQITFAGPVNGWAVLGYPPQRTLFHTTDGGVNWQTIEPTVIMP